MLDATIVNLPLIWITLMKI